MRIPASSICSLVLFVLSCAACGGGGGGAGGGPGAEETPPARSGSAVLLRWTGSAGSAGYVIHWGARSRAYDRELDVGLPPSGPDGTIAFVVDAPGTPGTYYFAVSSYDERWQESGLSNELSTFVP